MSFEPDDLPMARNDGCVSLEKTGSSSESVGLVNSKGPMESSNEGTSVPLSKMKKELGLMSAVSLVAGTTIGAGIFLTPNAIVGHVGSDGMALIVWLISGIVSLFGGLCYAELGTALPSSGGEYVYLRYAFGRLPAFLYSWSSCLILRPLVAGVILLTFANYVSTPFYGVDCPAPAYTVKLIAIAALVFITCVGCLSAKWSANVSSLFFFIKVFAILFLIVLGFVSLSQGHYRGLENGFRNTTIESGALVIAFYDSLWALNGWNNANYFVGELTSPKILPVALCIAIPLVITLYLLVNIAYMSLLPTATFLASNAIALDAAEHAIGQAGLIIMPLLVAASCFGAANGVLFCGSRITVAAAKRGDLPRCLGLVHDVYCTPVTAYIFQFCVALFYTVAVDINSLILFFSFVAWMFYGTSMVILLLLRRREPHLPRPFKVPIVLPVVMLLFALFLVITPFVKYPLKSFIALAFMIVSVPIYYIFVTNQLLSRYASHIHRASDWMTRTTQRVIGAS